MSTAPRFLTTIDAEISTLQRFLTLLQREQEMLRTGNIDDLQPLLEEKSGLAAKLSMLAEQRSQALAAAGIVANRAGVSSWLGTQPETSREHTAWPLLVSLASEARELNRVNGELIQLRLQHSTQALEALLGNNDSLGLYRPDGQNTRPSGRRISDKA
jgi:flagella synthesis protein FlgN